MSQTLITTYLNPDLDGFACAVAYAEFLNTQNMPAVAGVFGQPHDEAVYVMDAFHLDYPRAITSAKDYEKIILVDTSEVAGLDKSIDLQKVTEIIDHRKQNDSHLFPNAHLQIELVGSAATLIAEKFFAKNLTISKMSATLLYAAIVSNTLNFKAKVTTNRDRKMVEWLKQFVQIPDNFTHDMFVTKSDLFGSKLQARMKSDFAWFNLAGKRESIIQLEIVDADKLIETRKDELLNELQRLDEEMHLDVYFISIIDLLADRNFFVTENEYTQKLLSDIFHISFKECVAEHPGLIMRKEITPLIKEYIEQNG